MTTTVWVDGKELTYSKFHFSGGEIQIRFDEIPQGQIHAVKMRSFIRSSDDLMTMLLVNDAIIHFTKGDAELVLEIPYMPYARQDRVCAPGEAFSLAVMSRIVGNMYHDELVTWDIHSDVLNNPSKLPYSTVPFTNVPAAEFVKKITFKRTPVVVIPDKGAKIRAMQAAEAIGAMTIQAEKIRNPDTGEITGTSVEPNVPGCFNGMDLLIVDDICDGGRTFTELAKVLRPLTDGKIMLYVTHGIFSKGLQVFNGLIDEIYCPNVWPGGHDNHWVDYNWATKEIQRIETT